MKEFIIPEQIKRMIGDVVVKRAFRLAPNDTSEMANKINYRIEGDSIFIYCDSDHAYDMEYGRPPGDLSSSEKEDINDWARRHGIKNGRGVAKTIERSGIKAGTPQNPMHITSFGRNSYRPFMRPALIQSLPIIKKIIRSSFR